MQPTPLTAPVRIRQNGMLPGLSDRVATLTLLFLVPGVIAGALLPESAWGIAVDIALLVYLLFQLPTLKWLPALSLGCALILLVLTLGRGPLGWAAAHEGLQRASYVAGVLSVMGLMVEAARTSPLVRRVGLTIISQSRAQRYLSLAAGSHLLSIVLNIGTLNLLAEIMRRASGQTDAATASRTARETSQAIMRGFNSMPIWSPLAIGFAVTASSIQGLDWQTLLPWGVFVALSFLLVGWLLDGVDWSSTASPDADRLPGDWAAVRGFLLLISAVLLAATTLAQLTGTAVTIGTIAVVPVTAVLWLQHQFRRAGGRRLQLTWRRLRRQVPRVLPQTRTEICMVGGGALLGTLLGHLLHLEHLLPVWLPAGFPPLLLAAMLLVFILLLAQSGLGAIVGISIIASALPDPRVLGLEPLALATIYLTSWGIAAGITPSGATVSIMARVTRTPASTVARDWNGRYTLVACALTLGWVALIQWLATGNLL